MVSMVATLVIIGFCSLGVASVIMTRFVISVMIAVLAVLAWRIVMVLAIILMMLLIRPITLLVFVVSVLMVDVVGESVPVSATSFCPPRSWQIRHCTHQHCCSLQRTLEV